MTIPIKYVKEALMAANRSRAEFKVISPVLEHFHIRSDRILKAFDNLKSEILRGDVDPFLLDLWFSGELGIFAANVIAAGTTGKPNFESIFQVREYFAAAEKNRIAEEGKLDKLARVKAAELKAERQRAREKQAQKELAVRLGLDPAKLARLQRGDEEE